MAAMMATVEEFRRAMSRCSGRKTGTRYPRELRAFAVEFARKRLASGGTLSAAAKALGISDQTLTYWVRVEGRAVVVPVRLRSENTTMVGGDAHARSAWSGVFVLTPDGFRIGVGSVADAVSAVRALR